MTGWKAKRESLRVVGQRLVSGDSRLSVMSRLLMQRHWSSYLVIIVLWLAVDVVVAVSNDGVWVLDHAYSLREGGLVELGYRYIGYPLFARTQIELARLVGVDPLFGIVLGQRLIALAVGFVLARVYRWIGVGVFALVFSVTTLIQLNYILAEGLAVSLAALAAVAFARFWFGSIGQRRWLAFLAATILAIGIMRLQYSVLAIAPALALAGAWWRVRTHEVQRSFAVYVSVVVATLGLGLASYYVLVSAENGTELGSSSQNAESLSSVEYLSAWRTVFVLEDVAPSTPELAAFYGDGSPWPSWRTVRLDNDRADWPAAFRSATDELLDASRLNVATLRIKSLLGGLLGGRFDDMSGIKQRVASSSVTVRLSSTYASANVQRMGEQVFLDEYNDGREPSALIASSVILVVPTISRYSMGIAWVLFSLAGLALQRSPRGWLFVFVASVPHVIMAVVGATFLGDIYRWLLPTLAFSVVAVAASVGERLLTLVAAQGVQESVDAVG